MSRIGKKAVQVPDGVKVQVQGHLVSMEGPKGKVQRELSSKIQVKVDGKTIIVTRSSDERQQRSLHGLTRTLIANMVHGVTKGFTRVLEINGVGYRAAVKGNMIDLTVGFSHPVEFQLPVGVKAKVENNTKIVLESAAKDLVGETAAQIRRVRPPEPYQGKGIKFAEEVIRRKVGKSAGK